MAGKHRCTPVTLATSTLLAPLNALFRRPQPSSPQYGIKLADRSRLHGQLSAQVYAIFWYLDFHPLQLLGDFDLAPQSRPAHASAKDRQLDQMQISVPDSTTQSRTRRARSAQNSSHLSQVRYRESRAVMALSSLRL